MLIPRRVYRRWLFATIVLGVLSVAVAVLLATRYGERGEIAAAVLQILIMFLAAFVSIMAANAGDHLDYDEE
jgi:hypothetical protein